MQPHTTENKFTCDLYLENSKMKVIGVDPMFRGVPNDHISRVEESRFTIKIGTVPYAKPGAVELSYAFQNGIKNVPGYLSWSNSRGNSSDLSWAFKGLNLTIEVVKVRFQSSRSSTIVDDPRVNFSVVNSLTIDFTSTNISRSFSVSSHICDTYNCPDAED